MYQFTETTVINSLTDSSGLAKFAASTDNSTLLARRIGNFKIANIDFAGTVYKAPYVAGVKEIAQVTVPVVTAGLVIRLAIDIRLSQQTESEYANAYLYFKKPIVVEVIATGTAATDAAALIAQINYIKTEFGWQFIVASSGGGAVIVLTAINNNQRFWSVQVLQEQTNVTYPNSMIDPQYTDVTGGTFSVTTHGNVGFGDDEYMIRSIMLPTYENTRYFGTNKEERPIIGGNYSQYTFGYTIEKSGDPGIVSGAKSKTTQVFYVLSTLVSTFEPILTGLGLSLVPILPGAGAFKLTGHSPINAGDTMQLVPQGAIGTVTYTSSVAATATVNAAGIVTGVAVNSSTPTVITATDSTGATATFNVTVVA